MIDFPSLPLELRANIFEHLWEVSLTTDVWEDFFTESTYRTELQDAYEHFHL